MSELDTVEERLRAVTAKIAEREHLLRVRELLARDVASEEQRVKQLAAELQFEKADVERLTTGVMGFLHNILTDGKSIEEERREVEEAQARLREAQGSLDLLRHQVREVEAKLAGLVPAELDRQLFDARAAREQVLVRSGTATGAQLQDLAIRMESIDIELVPLADALNAAVVAYNALVEIVALLESQPFDAATKRAKALAGEAQAKIVIFKRALSDIAYASFRDPLDVHPSDTTFADDWVKQLLGKRPPQERVANARAEMVARIERIGALLAPLRARHDELAARRAALVAERQKLVG